MMQLIGIQSTETCDDQGHRDDGLVNQLYSPARVVYHKTTLLMSIRRVCFARVG